MKVKDGVSWEAGVGTSITAVLLSEFHKNTKLRRSFQKVTFCYESSKYNIFKKACLASSSFIDF